jgi:broad specificity phosphatase PhoE
LVSPIFSPLLRELDFGEWDCKTYTEILQIDSIGLDSWYRDPFTVAPPNGETLSDLGNRLNTWIEDTLLTACTFQTILVISHGGPIRWFMSTKVEKDLCRFWEVKHISHGGMYMVDWDAQSWIESRS